MYYASKQAPRGEIADRRIAPSSIPHLIGESEILSSAIRRPTCDLGVISESYPLDRAADNRRAAAEQLPWSVTRVSIARRLHNSKSADQRCSLCPRRPRPYFLREEFFSFIPFGRGEPPYEILCSFRFAPKYPNIVRRR